MSLLLKKKIAIMPIIVAIIGLVIISSMNEESTDKAIFHVRLADPNMYENGVFTDVFTLKEGRYFFKFVPNGDSPKYLSISLKGESISFNENFVLNGTPHDTGISQYFTWDYDGEKIVEAVGEQEVTIRIDPHGNTLGAISVYILENDNGVTP